MRRAVRTGLGAEVRRCFYAELSSGATFGLLLSDGERIAAKVHLPRVPYAHARAVSAVQRHVRARGIPCPPVVADPLFDGTRSVRFESWSTDGEERERVSGTARDRMAETLLRLVTKAGACPARADLLREDWPASLWPVPHNDLFDFGTASLGAEWIDERARTCRAIVDRSDPVTAAGHMDWSLQHFRFRRDDAIATIYDWDSLRLVAETRLVGSAAACFTLRSDAASVAPPSREDARAFVAAYDRLRDTPFTADEWRAVSAAALYAVCYGARCEHCFGSAGGSRFRRRLLKLPAHGYFEV